MTSQSFCSLSVSLRDAGLIGTSGNRLTGFNGLIMLLWVGVFVFELSVLPDTFAFTFGAAGGKMFANQPDAEFVCAST